MSTSKTRGVPAELERVQQRFELWRRTHRSHSRIPESLWAAAARVAGTCGVYRVAKALRLDYYSLKERFEQQVVPDRVEGIARTAFVELAPLVDQGNGGDARCECMLELEDGDGAKMRVHLRGVSAPDLAALCRSFWSPAS